MRVTVKVKGVVPESPSSLLVWSASMESTGSPLVVIGRVPLCFYVTHFFLLHAVTSAFAWAPVVEMVLRVIAVAITWVAATAGLGAAVLSRGGTRRATETFAAVPAVNDLPWQTPTPVTGVVAARRPTPTSSGRDR